MGLFVARVRFPGEPPANEEILAELARRIGSVRALEPIERRGDELRIATLLDPVAYPYLLKLLSEHGGVLLHYATSEPSTLVLPDYVDTPWVELGLGRRLAIRARFFFGLTATARRRAR